MLEFPGLEINWQQKVPCYDATQWGYVLLHIQRILNLEQVYSLLYGDICRGLDTAGEVAVNVSEHQQLYVQYNVKEGRPENLRNHIFRESARNRIEYIIVLV